ncbi:hypothetical protein A2U01_0084976, partial [Trifolium medium]|nr:hypothetical protein [Trifolium medium]
VVGPYDGVFDRIIEPEVSAVDDIRNQRRELSVEALSMRVSCGKHVLY